MTDPGVPEDDPSAPDTDPEPDRTLKWRDLQRAAERARAEVSRPERALDSSEDAKQTSKDRSSNRRLRLAYGILLLVVMAAQIAVADYVFYLYGEGNAWQIPPEAIGAWLGATVIEVIGVVIVIVRFLFSKDSLSSG